MTNEPVFLADRGVIRVAGEEATSFLQGLVTNDVERLNEGEARYAALLTPQGKILFDFLIVRARLIDGPAFLIDCAAAQAADLAKRLNFYRLRSKVAIADMSADLGVVAALDAPLEGGVAFSDPRDQRLGFRAIFARARAASFGEAGLQAYEARRVALGAPKAGVDFAFGDVFPHDIDMDWLHGLDFEKGCYVGQEVVSRMRHRGDIRKRAVRVRLEGAAPPPGASILDGELSVGMLGAASGERALALIRIDRANEAKAAGRSLKAEGATIIIDDERVG